jgi:hypothetical protein
VLGSRFAPAFERWNCKDGYAMTTSTEALPRADDAERYILGCFVRFPERADEVLATQLRSTDFVDPLHQKLFQAFIDQHVRGGIDPVLVGRQTDSAGELLILAENVTTSVHVPAEAAKIIETRRKRQLHQIVEAAGEAALNGQASSDVFNALTADLVDFRQEREATEPQWKFLFSDLRTKFPTLNQPLIDGVCRLCEVVNIISVSKAGKSWLAYYLALCIIIGRNVFERFATTPGRILFIDNELHPCTIAYRIPQVAAAMGIDPSEYEPDLEVWPMRGKLPSLADLEQLLLDTEPGTYAAIIYDAKYRFITDGESENDNAAETRFYNRIDRIAAHTGATQILIHHSSKGSQSDKRVTDVGAGAGAQSRAADVHCVLREHETEGVMVLEVAVRSFAPVAPIPLRWCFPLWLPADDIDPTQLKGRGTKQEERQQERDREGINATVKALMEGPASARQLRRKTGFGQHRQSRVLDLLAAQGQVTISTVQVGAISHEQYQLKD